MKNIFLTIFLLVFQALCTCAYCQYEWEGIGLGMKGKSDPCYQIYFEANKNPASPKTLDDARKMWNLASKSHNHQAMVMSSMLKMNHYRAIGKIMDFRSAAAETREIAKTYKQTSLYYEAYDLEARVLYDNGDFTSAITLANKMLEEATAENYEYGKFLALRQSASGLKRRRLNEEALVTYEKAISYAKELDSHYAVETYLMMFGLVPKAQRDSYVKKAWAASKSSSDSILLYSREAIYAGERGDKEAFFKNYIPLKNHRHFPYGLTAAQQTMLRAFDAYFSGDYEGAVKITGELTNAQQKYAYIRGFATKQKDWKRAYDMQVKITQYRDSLSAVLQRNDFADFDARVGSMKLQREIEENKRQLEYSNNLLVLQKDKARIEAEHHLTLMRQIEERRAHAEAESGKLFAEQERKNMEIENERLKFYMLLGGVLIAFLLLGFGIMTYINIHKRRAQKKEMQLMKEIKQARDVAERANSMKDIFVQNMSHEIRTPLNAVMGFAQILACPGLPVSDEEKIDYGRHIENNGQLLLMLIDDILNISDINNGNFKITFNKDRVNEICRLAMSVVQYRVPYGVQMDFTTEVDDDFCINTDARRVQQVLVNYLSNACKHTQEGSITVHVSLKEHPGWIVFSVTDTGEGVPADQADRIFERFTKLNNFVQGTGIGLNVCMNVALKLGGKVRLDTTYTDGARFIFELPMEEEA